MGITRGVFAYTTATCKEKEKLKNVYYSLETARAIRDGHYNTKKGKPGTLVLVEASSHTRFSFGFNDAT